MATTRLMPLHIGKGRDISTAIADIIDYVENPQKTDFGKFIYGYECDTRIADAVYLLSVAASCKWLLSFIWLRKRIPQLY